VASEPNVELARRGYEAVLRGDLDVIAGILAPDVKWHGGDPTAVGACQNRTQALEVMRGAIEHGNIGELVDVVGSDDKFVVILRTPHEPGAPGRLVANLTTFHGGIVVEMVHYADPDDALAAAGLTQH
jgi:ketosteroid isomerase-like protein